MKEFTIAENLEGVRGRIAAAAKAANRSTTDIALLAVSKTKPEALLREAYGAGQRAFGENYVQEGVDKITALADLAIEWHFIGPLQSNKTKAVAEHFAWVHGIDRFKIAQRLSDQRPTHLPPLQVCLQVNVSGEATKSGVAPQDVSALATQIQTLPNLRLRGLMAIPAPAPDLAAQRAPFALLRQLREELNGMGFALDTLSMGMSSDLEAAIYEGATMVRVGTDIFGARD
jgi:hypothetical protein